MYGKEFPTFDDICHHKYVKRERIGDKWRYFYDTKITGEAYLKDRLANNDAAWYNKRKADGSADYAKDTVARINKATPLTKKYSKGVSQMVRNFYSGQRGVDPRDSKYQQIESGNAAIRREIHQIPKTVSRIITPSQVENLHKEIGKANARKSEARKYEAMAAKANRDYYTKSLAGRISKAGMDIKKIINTIKNPPEVKKYKDVKTGISYKEKTYKDANGKVKEVRTTMSGAPIIEKQKKAAKERKTKATAQQLANLARIDSIQQKYGDAMRKSYNGQNINDVRKKNTKKK